MKEIFTIEEYDDNDCHLGIIGVCDSTEECEKMCREYFAEYEIVDTRDIRDSGIEYEQIIQTTIGRAKILVRYFNINQL